MSPANSAGHAASDCDSRQLLRRACQPHVRQTPEQGAKGDLTFQTRQRCSQAIMDALAKGEMLILSAQNIQRFGIIKLLWISIDRDQRSVHQLAFADQSAVHENILTRPALIRE